MTWILQWYVKYDSWLLYWVLIVCKSGVYVHARFYMHVLTLMSAHIACELAIRDLYVSTIVYVQ